MSTMNLISRRASSCGRPLAGSAHRATVAAVQCHARPPVVPRRHVHRRAAQTTDEVDTPVDAEAAVAESPEEAASIVDRVVEILGEDITSKPGVDNALMELEEEVQALRESAAESAAESARLTASVAVTKDQLLRLTADFDNFRRRTAAQNSLLTESTRGDVIKQLLPIVDGFEQARTQVKADTDAEHKINNSYQGLYKQMVDLMRTLGVEPVPTVGTPFDPNVHEAIMREASADHPDGTVLVEFRKGFRIGEKLLRPAMVQVSFTEDAPVPFSSAEE